MRPKKCKATTCSNTFTPERGFQNWCSPDCAIQILKDKQEKKKRKELRQRKQEILTLPALIKKAQVAFNAYIRERDKDEPCISCGRYDYEIAYTFQGGKWDCGHYLSRGSHPELRFNALNAHKQCKSCNGGAGKHTRKNRTVSQEYRANLVERIGQSNVEWLEGPHQAQNWTREEVREIEAYYKQKLKQLRADR